MGLTYREVSKILQQNSEGNVGAGHVSKKREKFQKLHARARMFIGNFVKEASVPLSARDIQTALREEIQLSVTTDMIKRYLKQELQLVYKKIKPITFAHNNLPAKLQRQYAGAQYISLLAEGKTIINIDESTLDSTDTRKRGWCSKGRHNMMTHMQRLASINIIAGVSSNGDFLYTINQGRNNSQTVILFLSKLCQHLNS